ncbi:MAG: hypothetical protein FJY34_00690 [Betaproteobacteria bacterium]|nr:hypothetical protein [Betaproteobacteria bacterium]
MIPRLGSALLLLTAALPSSQAAAQGRTTYCCTGDNGRQICSDVLPEQCYGKAYREVNSRGMTIKKIEAPLTPEQRAMREAEAKQARDEELRRKEEDRRNRALLATYSSEQDIDYVRDRAVADVEKSIKASQEKLAELNKRKEQFDNEAEFYKKKSPPPQLQAQMRDNDTDIKAQQTAIDARNKDIEALKKRYEDEKLRYRELTKARAAGRSATPPGADARPR